MTDRAETDRAETDRAETDRAETDRAETKADGEGGGGAPLYAELHASSAYSLLRAGSSVEALAARAAALGLPALALADYMTLGGVVRHQTACARHGVRAIVGVELAVADPRFGDLREPATLVVLAENRVGYARLCRLLTDANLAAPAAPVVPFAALAAEPAGLIVLTGGRDGALARLLLAGRGHAAEALAARYAAAFGRERVFVELQHHRLPDSVTLLRQLAEVADGAGLRCVATNGVRHATREDYALHDLLACVRLGMTVDTPHRERPRNEEACLKGADEMAALFAPYPWGRAALAVTMAVAARCDVALLRGTCTAPRVPLPEGTTPGAHLRALCEAGLVTRYGEVEPGALSEGSPHRRQLARELDVIERLGLEEFFLCVQAIMAAARGMGIRVSGRGSAANSLVAYLLGITGVDPIRHKLLFERFLSPDRAGMPDIDVDVQSDRRDELIRYVERTFTHEHAAMVANVIRYRPRLALRDAAKALGYPLPLVNRLAKVLPHHTDPADVAGYRDELAAVLDSPARGNEGTADRDGEDEAVRARCLARLPLLLALVPRLCGLPRHLSLHNGGMVLTREPLAATLPVRVSANGVRALEVDKDDVERLGLIKFDLLGLRTLGAIEEALALIEETTGRRPDVDRLPTEPPDAATMRLVRAGQTVAVFQIESPGQWHLLAQTQPETFDDLVIQTALFRPGPIQANMVHPYVERRRQKQRGEQRDAVQTPWCGAPPDDFWTAHPILGPILRDSEGILLFQEQILQIAHAYAGLSYGEADAFRRAMGRARTSAELAAMRGRFISGAAARGETPEDAGRVFDAIAGYAGYGFCRSHAAEFARIIYQTAWLKAHWPAHYLAAFLSSQPAGFFPAHVVLHEARLLGIPVLPPDVNRSASKFSVERVGATPRRPEGRWAIRIGLRQVAQVGDALADAILWERRARPFASLADLCRRLRPAGLTWEAAEALVLAGACDALPPCGTAQGGFAALAPRLDRRRRLWHLRELWPLVVGAAATTGTAGRRRRRAGRGREPEAEQLALEWAADDGAIARGADVPALPGLTGEERDALDYGLLGMSARPHPMRRLRRTLRRDGVRAIAELADVPAGRVVRVAGWPISAQRPPTAKGMAFVVLEDEGGRLPVAVPPRLADDLYRRLRDARAVVVAGRVERVHWYRSLLAHDLQPIAA